MASTSLALPIIYARMARMTIPDCQGWARFDTRERAEYIRDCHAEEFGTPWAVVECGEHFHVEESVD